MKSSKTIAHELVKLADEKKECLTPMQLLKLVYIAHGWMLALYNRPLIREDIQAWQYGPVIPSLYNKIRRYKSGPVTEVSPSDGETLDQDETSIVQQVYEKYGQLSGPALSQLTHAQDTPWDVIYDKYSFGRVIPNHLIKDYYVRLSGDR